VRANVIKVETAPEYHTNVDNNKSIQWVRFGDIVAKVGFALGGNDTTSFGIRVVVDNPLTARLISDVAFVGVTLDASGNSESAGNPLVVERADRVSFTDVKIAGPHKTATIDDANDVELRDCSIDSPRATGHNCLTVASLANCTNIRVLGGLYRKAKGHGIQLGLVGTPSYSVTGFQVLGGLIDQAWLNGLLIWNALDGVVVGNTIIGSGTGNPSGSRYGIQEVYPPSNRNLIIANRLTGNASGPILFFGPNTEVARNIAPGIIVPDSGGYRQTIDGWNQEGTLTGTNVEIKRFGLNPATGGAGRFRAARSGSVTGIVITSDAPWTQGTLTVEVYINNSGTAGGTIVPTGLTTVLDSTHTTRNSNTQAVNIDTFVAGDELTIVFTASTSPAWAPAGALIRCALEIED